MAMVPDSEWSMPTVTVLSSTPAGVLPAQAVAARVRASAAARVWGRCGALVRERAGQMWSMRRSALHRPEPPVDPGQPDGEAGHQVLGVLAKADLLKQLLKAHPSLAL
jgi:hypothetical protein